jgi:hypothetical protein
MNVLADSALEQLVSLAADVLYRLGKTVKNFGA